MQGLGATQQTGTLNSISGHQNGLAKASRLGSGPADTQTKAQEAFQDFVAGTFFGEMLKSLHAMHDKPAYFHGGQAEELFQSQLDQIISGQMAKQHGAALADPLFEAFQRETRGGISKAKISETYGQQEVTEHSGRLNASV